MIEIIPGLQGEIPINGRKGVPFVDGQEQRLQLRPNTLLAMGDIKASCTSMWRALLLLPWIENKVLEACKEVFECYAVYL
ncbi:hypothetical protein HanIR_Chr10g0497871 [Helianthus annuus]|nr:hypothetical protein HanIR_Chr10g0497871 [Helianthus annuus]KAJ0698365.1 hypothetical protein HanLR1_Chr10g0379221 [Helianthus annuus]